MDLPDASALVSDDYDHPIVHAVVSQLVARDAPVEQRPDALHVDANMAADNDIAAVSLARCVWAPLRRFAGTLAGANIQTREKILEAAAYHLAAQHCAVSLPLPLASPLFPHCDLLDHDDTNTLDVAVAAAVIEAVGAAAHVGHCESPPKSPKEQE